MPCLRQHVREALLQHVAHAALRVRDAHVHRHRRELARGARHAEQDVADHRAVAVGEHERDSRRWIHRARGARRASAMIVELLLRRALDRRRIDRVAAEATTTSCIDRSACGIDRRAASRPERDDRRASAAAARRSCGGERRSRRPRASFARLRRQPLRIVLGAADEAERRSSRPSCAAIARASRTRRRERAGRIRVRAVAEHDVEHDRPRSTGRAPRRASALDARGEVDHRMRAADGELVVAEVDRGVLAARARMRQSVRFLSSGAFDHAAMPARARSPALRCNRCRRNRARA